MPILRPGASAHFWRHWSIWTLVAYPLYIDWQSRTLDKSGTVDPPTGHTRPIIYPQVELLAAAGKSAELSAQTLLQRPPFPVDEISRT